MSVPESRPALTFRPVDRTEGAFARVAVWRREAYEVATDFEADLCDWLGLNAGQARLLATLYLAQQPMTREALMGAAKVSGQTFRLYITAIREALGPGCLPRSDPETGYQLTQAGRAECERAVGEAGLERLRRDLGAAA